MVGLTVMCATTAEATPAFARQMDMDCMSCHFQNIPKLNSFGRDFKMSGFTMTSGKEMKSEPNGGLGLPETLNMAFVIKARVLDGEPSDAKTEIFDESAFIFGGKIADNVGTSMEFTAGLIGGKVTFATEALGGRIGATYHMTDALGAFAGTEIYTTGLYRPVRQFENRKKTNIFQNLGIGEGEATGAQVYYRANGFYVTVGGYVPMFAASAETGTDSFKTLARAAYELNLGSSTIALGGYYIGGNTGKKLTERLLDPTDLSPLSDKVHGLHTDALDRESAGIDLQIESAIADMSLMVTGGYVFKNDYTSYKAATAAALLIDPLATYTTGAQEKTGYHLDLQINPVERFGVKMAILGYNDELVANSDYTILSTGLEYNMRQNVRFCIEYSNTSHDDSLKDGDEFLFMSMISF